MAMAVIMIHAATARRNDACPTKIIRFKRSDLIERTNRSAYAFRFGDLVGSIYATRAQASVTVIHPGCTHRYVWRNYCRRLFTRAGPKK